MNLNMSLAKGISKTPATRATAVAAVFAAAAAFAAIASAAPAAWDLSLSSAARAGLAREAIRSEDIGFAGAIVSGFAAEPEPGVRAWMVRAAARLRPPGLQPFLTRALGDPSPEVRQSAAAALGRLGGAAALSSLAAALGAEADSGVRLTIAFWLGFGPGPGGSGAVAALSSVLASDRDPNVRLQAAQSLARLAGLGSGPARSALKLGLKDSDPRVRRAAGGT